jgi:putative membrane protein
MDYMWTKAIHVIAVLVWVSGMVANGLAFVVTAEDKSGLGGNVIARLHVWDRWVTNPAQGIAWLAGLTMIWLGGWFPDPWLIVKLLAVTFLAALHGVQSATLRKMADGRDVSKRLPLVRLSAFLVIGAITIAVTMVIVKPF